MSISNEELDAVILAAASANWQKVAVVISAVFDALAQKGMTYPAQGIAERIYVLAAGDALESSGNIRRWRDGNVRVRG